MIDAILNDWFRWQNQSPCFQIHGKGRREAEWRVVSVYASDRHDCASRWPLFSGSCVTWTSEVIVVGWDFAEMLLREQADRPASRRQPVRVAGGRISDRERRREVGAPAFATASEILAHEVGHTWQALRLGPVYLPFVGSVTIFQEGPNPWNHFENEASEEGLFGGLVNRSVCRELLTCL